MRKRAALAAVAAAAVLTPTPGLAQGANGAGLGLMTCQEAGPVFGDPAYRSGFMSWALGYMTGLNSAWIARERRYRDLSGLNVDSVVGALRTGCAADPNGILLQGADRLWLTLQIREWAQP